MSDLHCWKGLRDHLEDVHGWGTDAYWEAWAKTWSEDGTESYDGTCMLPDGHEGEHVFTRDDEIVVAFVDEATHAT